jgi:4-amino-4-deoxy-L-arabinose transferase-like glycosyltransferase
MLSKTTNKILLAVILIIAFILRTYAINTTPALNPDEAAIGYNAYSLLLTAKDEHGASWPLHFKSFGDYKPGGYFYLVLPFVKFLGLTPLAVRLPNLILSVVAIFFLYKIVLLLSKNKRLALISAAVLAFSPWHIHFSRGGWESCAALSFITMGTYFFFKSIEEKFTKNILLFIIFYVASLYIYHSVRIVAPALALCLFIMQFNFLKNNFKKLFVPVFIGIALAIPVLFSFLHNGGAARFGGVGLTADQGPIWRSNELINQHDSPKLINRIMHNKKVLYLVSWGQKYFSHFDLNFLAIDGDEVPRSKVPEMGQIYLIELPFLLLGIVALVKQKTFFKNKNLKYLTLSWLIVAPLASSLTFQAPSALRALSMVIPLSILTALGLYTFLDFIANKNYKIFILPLFSAFYLFNIAYYLDSYFVHYAKRYPFAWQYEFDKLVPLMEQKKINFDNVYITDKYDQPYILFLFYSKYPPSLIQKEIKLTPPDQFGFSTVRTYDKYHFQKINWSEIPSKSLVVTSDEPVPVAPIEIINFPNGQPAFKIYSKP